MDASDGRLEGRRLEGLSERLRERVGRPLFNTDVESSFQALLRRGPLNNGEYSKRAALSGRIIPRQLRGFPFTKPTWPGGINRELDRSELGTHFETDWSRDPWAAAVRAGIVESIVRPGVSVVASPTIVGLDRLEGVEGPVIFAGNHHSHLDTFLMLSAIPTRFRRKAIIAAGADYWFDKKWKAVLSALAIGAIPIERKKVSRTSSDLSLKVLRDGHNLIIFPEGGRSNDGWAGEFKPGAAFLSTRSGAPIVPVHLFGTDAILPKGQNLPKRGQTVVTFGLPIVPLPGEDPRDMSVRVETAIAQLADEHRSDWWTARRNAAKGGTPSLQGPTTVGWRKAWSKSADRPSPASKKAEPTSRSWP
jgi:1-acyl-sn-glycerol-3-phosphate acyltransferase